jgi:hypothetical protein
MKTLQIFTVPEMELIQKACETLVCKNHIDLATEYNVEIRRGLLMEAEQAEGLVNHLRELILENTEIET